MKLDPIRRAMVLLSSDGRIRFVDFKGNTLRDLPIASDELSSFQFDGTYLAFIKEDNKIHVLKRVSDSFDFTPFVILQMPGGVSTSMFRLKNNELLAACIAPRQTRDGLYELFHLNFFDLEHPDLVATLAMYGTPGCVDFDDDLLYVTLVKLGKTQGGQVEELEGVDTIGPLALLYKPILGSYEWVSTADAFLNANLHPTDFIQLSPSEIVNRLLPLIRSRQVLLGNPKCLAMMHYISYGSSTVNTGIRNRRSEDYLTIVLQERLYVYPNRRQIGNIGRKLSPTSCRRGKQSNSSYDQHRDAMQLLDSQLDLKPRIWQVAGSGVPANVAACNGRCAMTLGITNKSVSCHPGTATNI